MLFNKILLTCINTYKATVLPRSRVRRGARVLARARGGLAQWNLSPTSDLPSPHCTHFNIAILWSPRKGDVSFFDVGTCRVLEARPAGLDFARCEISFIIIFKVGIRLTHRLICFIFFGRSTLSKAASPLPPSWSWLPLVASTDATAHL